MKKPKKSLGNIDRSWTLFLDRDGVINEKIEGDYVRSWEQFKFLPGVKEAIKALSQKFGKIIVITNQQGIGKGVMTESDLTGIHLNMVKEIKAAGGRIDKVYHCPHLASENCNCRKPKTGMALQAKADFPDIDFEKSVLAGDSLSDIMLGKALRMKTIFIKHELKNDPDADAYFQSLQEFVATGLNS